MTEEPSFTPALGKAELTADYDRVISVMTREKNWRGRLLRSVTPQPGEAIADLGCGTGTFAVMMANSARDARIIAIDPDPEVLEIARAKARGRANIEFVQALGGDHVEGLPYGQTDKVISSLVLHQRSMEAKQALLLHSLALLKCGGTVFIADYGIQESLLMQLLFRQVRSLDGYENTRANKDGLIPLLIAQAGFTDVLQHWQVQTPTGSITLWTGKKPAR